MKLKRTDKTLIEVGFMLRKGLQDELKFQKHNATGKLSRGLRYHIKNNVLSMMSSVSYWKAVNNPLFAKIPNLKTIERWMGQRNIEGGKLVAMSILKRLSNGKKVGQKANYGNRNYPNNSMRQPYAYYTEGNSIPRRTNFAGYTANKFKDKIVAKLAPSIGKDIADMIAAQIKKNNPKTNVQKAF
jgi:hypothetical protein